MRKIATTIKLCCVLLLVSYHVCIFAGDPPDLGKFMERMGRGTMKGIGNSDGKEPKDPSQNEKDTSTKEDEEITTNLFQDATFENFESMDKLKDREHELEIFNKDLLEPRR